jgi:hypothetical protein
MDNWHKFPEETPPQEHIVFTYNSKGEIRMCKYEQQRVGWKWSKQFVFANIMSKWHFPDLLVTHWTFALPAAPDKYNRVKIYPEALTMLRESAVMWKGHNPDWDKRIKDLLSRLK